MHQLYFIATILPGFILAANAYSYKDAENWSRKYPKCNGQHQSPIRFKPTGQEMFSSIKEEIRLKDFHNIPKKMNMKNTGHTVELKADWDGEPPSCTGGPLHGKYIFEKATFHWAQKPWAEELPPDDPNEDLSMLYLVDFEMHAFFYKADFKSFEKAETRKGGLAVFKMGYQTGYNNPEHLFDNLGEKLHKIRSPNSTAEIKPFPLLSDFDNGYTIFLFYEGSLDYPPCSESVTWLMVEAGNPVPDSIASEFKKIKLSNGDVSNVRPIQPSNKRQVKFVYNHNKH